MKNSDLTKFIHDFFLKNCLSVNIVTWWKANKTNDHFLFSFIPQKKLICVSLPLQTETIMCFARLSANDNRQEHILTWQSPSSISLRSSEHCSESMYSLRPDVLFLWRLPITSDPYTCVEIDPQRLESNIYSNLCELYFLSFDCQERPPPKLI